MNLLSIELLKGLLEEDQLPNKKEVIGMFGGGFKPPTVGHLEVVKRALNENPELDRMIIIVGSGVRDSISQEESLAIWNFYKKYLPGKVEVIPAPKGKAPIRAVYSYAKDNPDKEIYWFIGAREGNEDDSLDILKRTKSLQSGNYPNVKVKVITTTGSVSGTKARQALLAGDKEGFIQFLPDIPEVDQIWDMLSDVVAEEKTKPSILDKYDREELKKGIEVEKEHTDNPKIALKIALDHLDEDPKYYTKLATLGLEERISFKPEFTKDEVEFIEDEADNEMQPEIDIDLSSNHFFDRLNDPRNYPDIEPYEVEDFFDKLADKKDEFIEFLKKYKEVVAKDRETNINIPFMKIANKAIAKTIMRKKNFLSSTPILPLEEGGRYDQEVLSQARYLVNLFKANFGEKVEGEIEGYLKGGDESEDKEIGSNYTIYYKFEPDEDLIFDIGLPFVIDAEADRKELIVTASYSPSEFPEAYNNFIAELKDSLRHELEHVGQYQLSKPTNPSQSPDKYTYFQYFTFDFEVPAFVRGLNKKARTKKITFTQAVDDYLDNFVENLSDEQMAEVKRIWIDYAKKNVPGLKLQESKPLKEVGEGSSQPFPYEEDAFPLEYIKDYGIGRIEYTVKAEAKGEPIDIRVSGKFKRRRSKIKGGEKEYGLLDFQFGPTFGTDKTPTINDKTYMFRLIATLLEILKEINSKIKISFIGYEAEPRRHKLYTLIIKKAFPNATVTRSERGSTTQWDLYESKDPKKEHLNENFEGGLQPYIDSLTDYMGSNGLTLKPHPSVEFIGDDRENAANIFGRTAYYMPSEQKIALYVLDRHPKDILRSYAHELIHHHQNLNGTLENFQTTNTNEDGDLERIEREAYENGNILFRNWEDSIKNGN